MTEALPEEFWLGVEQFNQGEFYACHDTLEAIWIEAPMFEKKFYQGILQVSVALYHLGNRNWRGAVILLGEGINRLREYEPEYGGIDIEQFRADALELLSELQTLGAETVDRVVLTQQSSQTQQSSSDPFPADPIVLHPPIIQKYAAALE
jgi:predicted metal-dependent hydrolase